MEMPRFPHFASKVSHRDRVTGHRTEKALTMLAYIAWRTKMNELDRTSQARCGLLRQQVATGCGLMLYPR